MVFPRPFIQVRSLLIIWEDEMDDTALSDGGEDTLTPEQQGIPPFRSHLWNPNHTSKHSPVGQRFGRS